MGLQSLGSAGQVEGIGVSVQQVLESLQGGLAGLEGRKHTLGIWVFTFPPLLPIPVPCSSPNQELEEARATATQGAELGSS